MSGVVQYSSGTEETGNVIAKALGYSACKRSPDFKNFDVFVGWGSRRPKGWDQTGLDLLVKQGGTRVLNHPTAIFENRDKIQTLEKLKQAEVSVSGFVVRQTEKQSSENFEALILGALSDGVIAFPIIGMNRRNRREPYWCFVEEDIRYTLASANVDDTPIDYFRSYAPGVEYRIHTLRDEVIFAQEKKLSKDPLFACVEDLTNRLAFLRKKEGKMSPGGNLDEWSIRILAKEMLQGSNHLQRSLKRGWMLQDVSPKDLPDEVISAAVTGLDAVGLDLGAVSVAYGGGKARVTNITTGPALEERHVPLYVAAIEAFAGKKVTGKSAKKKEVKGASEKKASSELVSELARQLSGISEKAAVAALKLIKR